MIKAIQIQDDAYSEQLFKACAEAGFGYVAMGFGSSKSFHSDDWEEHIALLRGNLDKYGLKCVQTHLPYYNLLIDSSVIDDAMETAIERCIRATKLLGGSVTAFHPRSAVDRNYSRRAADEDNLRALERYLPVAESEGITVAVENLPIFPGSPLWRFYSSDYEDITALVDRIDSPNLGICWDTGHAALTGIDQVQALRHVGNRLRCTHIHNNKGRNDDHLLPFYGTIEWEKVMPVFGEIGYSGPFTLEPEYSFNPMTEGFARFAKTCIDYVTTLI